MKTCHADREPVESKISPKRGEAFTSHISCRLLTPGVSMTKATRIGKGVDANSALH